ncbi:MAG: hypothetical protein AB7T58_01190 [Hyphomonadaceae bacterium]
MWRSIIISGLFLAACASPAAVTTTHLVAADAATSLAVGDRVTQMTSSQSASEGMDPIVNFSLRHADGRSLIFQEGNHTQHDLMATAPGGPLAQIMGLPGDATTRLYHATSGENASESAFFCGPQGPAAIGTHEGADGVLLVVGLREAIQFETRPDGEMEAAPYSPDKVCARLRFRRG